MSFFTKAQGVEVQGGTFTSITNNYTTNNTAITSNNQNGPTGIDILREASVPEAAHDSAARTYSPRCFSGTREQYIEDITHWAIPSLNDTPKPIYWMRGPAGVGKSAIAQTCTESLHEKGALGAAFFFSINGQRKPEKFFPSIAYQLSTVHSSYRDLVDKQVRHDRTIVDKAMQFQFRYLIERPLRELEESGKGIRGEVQVFVDGLDECEGKDAQCEIIRIIAAAVSDGTLPLRWAVFSRPEAHLEAMFSRNGVFPYSYKVILPISRDVDGEIELYLRNGLNNILEHRNVSTQALWPAPDDMRVVVEAAGGLFIYATTVIRFVGHPDSIGPQKRLRAIIDVILNRRESDLNTEAPFAELDAFYKLILQHIPPKILPSVHLLLVILSQFPEISGVMLTANILGLAKDEFETICSYVSAVVHSEGPAGNDLELCPTIGTSGSYTQTCPEVLPELCRPILESLGGSVRFYHKSFNDFLVDPTRSGSYCTRSSEAQAKHFVKVHLDYDCSFCWHGLELVLAPGVPNSAASLSYPYTNELINSLLKALVYLLVGNEDPDEFPVLGESGRSDADCDFRKHIHIWTTWPGLGRVSGGPLWGDTCWTIHSPGVQVRYNSPGKYSKFDIIRFKSMIKQREQANIIHRYHPNLISKVKSLFHIKSQEDIEYGLYRMGHGEKSIFWYWEIHHKLRGYREFRAINLAEGKREFREQFPNAWSFVEDGDDEFQGREGGGESSDGNEVKSTKMNMGMGMRLGTTESLLDQDKPVNNIL